MAGMNARSDQEKRGRATWRRRTGTWKWRAMSEDGRSSASSDVIPPPVAHAPAVRTILLPTGQRSRRGSGRQSRLRPGRKLSGEWLEAIAQTRSWTWPLLSAVVALVSAAALAAAHRQIDLGTYLLGGARTFQPDLYRVTYQSTGLGFTYPPFAALWFGCGSRGVTTRPVG